MKLILVITLFIVTIHQILSKPNDDLPHECTLPPKRGGCALDLERWYHKIEDRKCHKFVYSGCQGNENKFPSKQKCKQHCKVE